MKFMSPQCETGYDKSTNGTRSSIIEKNGKMLFKWERRWR